MIASLLLLAAAQAASVPSLGAIGRQALPAKGCAAYLWSAADRQLVAMAVADPATIRLSVDGETSDYARRSGDGLVALGFGQTTTYAGGDVVATLTMTVTSREKSDRRRAGADGNDRDRSGGARFGGDSGRGPRRLRGVTLRETLEAQRAAFMDELPVAMAVRKDRLHRAAAMIKDNADRFCDALSEDFGHRSREQSMLTDIGGSIAPITHALKHLERWARRDKRSVQFPLGLLGAKAWVEYQAKGVIGVISPWNFPVNLVMGPLAGIFAAGNRAMVKTSEFTPVTAAVFEDVSRRYFAAEELGFVSGGPEVGEAFAELPFDHLIFTGATGIGRHILHAAADNLTPVTLELGGKSPVIVGADADVAQAAKRVALGKMLNAGQICLAPDYVLTSAAEEPRLVEGLKAAASAMYPTLLANPDYTSVINDRHHQRLQDWLEDARAKGAQIEAVNPASENFDASNSRKMPLHIVRRVTDDMTIMQEEIFGPILPIATYEGIDDAIAQVNRRDRPLGLYYFGPDKVERRRVLDRTIAGGVTLDDVVFHVSMEDLPFGGVGPSGMGSYHGIDGFRTFSHAKAVFQQSRRFDVGKLAGLKPPYGRATLTSIARQMKS